MTARRNTPRKAIFWSFLDQTSQKGLQFLVTIILARLLAPSDVGVIGLLSLFLALAQSIIDSGFGQAITRMPERDRGVESSVFYFNLLMAGVAIVALWISAPFIARFFDNPILVPLTRVLSFNLFIQAFGLIQTALLTKELNFNSIFLSGFLSIVISGPASILLAYLGFGVWSLAWQSVIANVVRVAVLWFVSPWRPELAFSVVQLRKPFRFASNLLVSGLIDTGFRNIYQPLIGKLFSTSALGFYTIATRIPSLPAETLTSIVSRVTFPSFAGMQKEPDRLRYAMRKSLTISMLITTPVLVGLLAIAPEMIRLVLSDKWLPAAPMLQLYCLVVLLNPLHYVNINALLAIGRSDIFLRLEIIKKTIVVLLVLASWQWGVTGLLCAQIIVSLLSGYLNARHIGAYVGYSFFRQMADLMPYFLMAAAMAATVALVRHLPLTNALLTLTIEITAGAGVFVTLAWLYRRDDVREITQLLKVPATVTRFFRLSPSTS